MSLGVCSELLAPRVNPLGLPGRARGCAHGASTQTPTQREVPAVTTQQFLEALAVKWNTSIDDVFNRHYSEMSVMWGRHDAIVRPVRL